MAFLSIWTPPASAWTTYRLRVINFGGDYFYNYDFGSPDDPPSRLNVDWPVTMMFTGNANINKVKKIYWGLAGPLQASPMHMKLNDGAGWVWDSDRGTKSLGLVNCHLRLYADSDDRLYNLTWGYFVIGTSHYDYYELNPNHYHGLSEAAEAELSNKAEGSGYVWFVDRDCIDMNNNEPYREETDENGVIRHLWMNDRWATQVQLW